MADCNLPLNNNMRNILLDKVLDPPTSKKVSTGRISYGMMQFYIEAGGLSRNEIMASQAKKEPEPVISSGYSAPNGSQVAQ